MSSRTTERDRRNIAAWYAIANRDYDAAIQAYREIVKHRTAAVEDSRLIRLEPTEPGEGFGE